MIVLFYEWICHDVYIQCALKDMDIYDKIYLSLYVNDHKCLYYVLPYFMSSILRYITSFTIWEFQVNRYVSLMAVFTNGIESAGLGPSKVFFFFLIKWTISTA